MATEFPRPLSDRTNHGQRVRLLYNPAMRGVLFVSIIGLISSLAGANVPSWELQSGGGWHLTAAPTTQPIHDETLDRAESMMQHGQVGPAKKIVVNWIKTHKGSPIRDRALYLLGEC